MERCGQINIPEVDNTQDQCDLISSTDCVTVDRVSLKVHNVKGENLTKYLEKLDNKISILENKIIQLNREIDNLTKPDLNLIK